ncbi:MAG: hypothetical protein AB1762_08685 [Gemmatimonadota bacterium]
MVRITFTLGTLVFLAPVLPAQMVTGTTRAPINAPRPSTQPPVRFATPPQPRINRDFSRTDWAFPRGRFRSHDARFSCRSSWSACVPFARSGMWVTTPYVTETVVPYPVPYYVAVPVPAAAPAAPPARKPYDPAKSRMLTIGAGADGGAGVMRIEAVGDSVVRLVWLGTPRPVREARLYLADSAQRSLRSALVDKQTPSALFKISDVAAGLVYFGLTITFADGAIETTLVPYRKPAESSR